MKQNKQISAEKTGPMLNYQHKIIKNQHGSVINVALLILILIFLIGIGLHTISTTDIQIATNIKTSTTTFYEAESGLDAASELLEQNVACPTGFKSTNADLDIKEANIEGMIMVTDLTFWRNDFAKDPSPYRLDGTFDNSFIDAYYPVGADRAEGSTEEYTNLAIGGAVSFSKGSAIQMAAGYEGLGKGSGGGGATVLYDIMVYQHGQKNSSAKHTIQWGHKLGLGGACIY